jgi:hypothetical protein
MFKTALIVSGILAAIALSAPSTVTLGLFLLIIPGLVLALAPTIFVYLSLIAVIRWLLPPPGLLGWAAAVAMAIGIGWAVMQPMRWIETRKWEAELQPDMLPLCPCLWLAISLSTFLVPFDARVKQISAMPSAPRCSTHRA